MATSKKVKPAKNDTRPDLPWVAITQAAIKAQKLAQDNLAALGARVTPAFFTAFASDISALGTAVPAAMTARAGAVQLTASQTAALEIGHNIIRGIRTTVKGQSPGPDVQLAYWVGNTVNKTLVKSVRSALDTIGKRIAAQPAEAQSFGIAPEDATAITDAIAAIDAADKAQEQARAGAPQTTRDRNAVARRLLAGIKLISGAGMRTFASNPTLFANFAALTKKTA
jgi:hypothetical protein